MEAPVIVVDLDRPPGERWAGVEARAAAARRLIDFYLGPLNLNFGRRLFAHLVRALAIPAAYRAELDELGERLGLDRVEATMVNCFYDGVKLIEAEMDPPGCTAFAVDTPAGPLHARNLDWASDGTLLRDLTLVADFHRSGRRLFRAITWPGFCGVLSGIAPGRFAVTLNYVRSAERAAPAMPVTFRLRQLLESGADFAEAVEILRTVRIPCDCLLLVSGPQAGQMAVIERTPRTAVVREPEDGAVAVSNHYCGLAEAPEDTVPWTRERLADTRAALADNRPHTPEAALALLDRSRWELTMQQMVFRVADDTLRLRLPADPVPGQPPPCV